MKLAFICGSLEPGKDGVGDYTRHLATELIQNGHAVLMIALHEKYSDQVLSGFQNDNQQRIPVLRLPGSLAWGERIVIAKKSLEEFGAEWVSIQYVPYSFNRKGFPLRLPNVLSKIVGKRRVHLMFHETWVGATKKSPLKHKVYGFFQRIIACSVVKRLNPELVTTSNLMYKEILKKSGIKSELLTLFSNIPKVDFAKEVDLASRFDFLQSLKGNERIIGIFGTLHPEADLEGTIRQQLTLAQKRGSELVFIAFGRLGEFGLSEFSRLRGIFENSVKFYLLGEQSEENVSILFQILDIGISCTPIEFIGKSGVFAAMRYHNLEVLCPVSVSIPQYDSCIKEFNIHLFEKSPDSWGVRAVSQRFNELLAVS